MGAFGLLSGMPYVFPYEHIFMGGIAVLIVGLVMVRVKVARQRRAQSQSDDRLASPNVSRHDTPPLV